jgi:hypothetical protein
MKGSIKSFTKKASSLHQSIHQPLSVYAGAAVVALVSVLALTQPSEAKIVYTHANVVVSCGHVLAMHHPPVACFGHYNLDLNHDGVTDFTIEVSFVGGPECMTSWGVGDLHRYAQRDCRAVCGALLLSRHQRLHGSGCLSFTYGAHEPTFSTRIHWMAKTASSGGGLRRSSDCQIDQLTSG